MRGKKGTHDPLAVHRVLIRVPVDLYERIVRAAKADDRSIANWIVRVIRLRLDDSAPRS